MDSTAVIEAYLDGEKEPHGDRFHVEGNALILDGWWHIALMVGENTYILRDEPPPDGSGAVADIAAAMSRRGLSEVPGEHPLIIPLIYTELSTAGGIWKLWSTSPQHGEETLVAAVGAETVPREWSGGAPETPVEGIASHMEGARRIAGLPPSVVVAVGIGRDDVAELEAAIPEVRFERRDLGGIAPEACGDLGPHLILVDAREQTGRNFIMELRAAACGRFLPVAAVTSGDLPAGADVALDPGAEARTWRDALVALLP